MHSPRSASDENDGQQHVSDSLHSGDDVEGEQNPGGEQNNHVVEIELSSELLNTFYRKGRRRLHDLQDRCHCVVSLNRTRSTLRVRGSLSAIRDVCRHLTTLEGPCRNVSAAVWAELMRTRTLTDAVRGCISRLQASSGCRVHVERHRHEVRIFGEISGIQTAEALLKELADEVKEQVVHTDPNIFGRPRLKSLANKFGVAVVIEDGHIAVRGRGALVDECATKIREYADAPSSFTDDEGLQEPGSVDDEFKDSAENWAKCPNGPGLLLPLRPNATAQPESNGQQQQQQQQQQQPQQQRQQQAGPSLAHGGTSAAGRGPHVAGFASGADMPDMHKSAGFKGPPASMQSAGPRHMGGPPANMGMGANKKMMGNMPDPSDQRSRACPTCGCGPYCTQCGALLRQVHVMQQMLSQQISYNDDMSKAMHRQMQNNGNNMQFYNNMPPMNMGHGGPNNSMGMGHGGGNNMMCQMVPMPYSWNMGN